MDLGTFYIFGSKSSQDLDCLVIVDELPSSIQECHDIVHVYNHLIHNLLKPSKEVNCNIASITDNKISNVFKGTIDEVNNSVIDTYEYHVQYHDLSLTKVNRNVDEKIFRILRIILTFLSRSEHRRDVKKALKSKNLNVMHEILHDIDLSHITKTDMKKSVKYEDYLKIVAFQLGQGLALLDNVELYSKESICERYFELSPFIFRTSDYNINILEEYKKRFLDAI